MPKIYALHGEYKPGLSITNYLVVVGAETIFPGAEGIYPKMITDGGPTILIVENRGANICWMEPRDLHIDRMSYTIGSPNGISSAFDDPAVATWLGSTYRLKRNISPATLRALMTIAGGEELSGTEGEWIVLPDGRQRERVEP